MQEPASFFLFPAYDCQQLLHLPGFAGIGKILIHYGHMPHFAEGFGDGSFAIEVNILLLRWYQAFFEPCKLQRWCTLRRPAGSPLPKGLSSGVLPS